MKGDFMAKEKVAGRGQKKCPKCEKIIGAKSQKCKYCGQEFEGGGSKKLDLKEVQQALDTASVFGGVEEFKKMEEGFKKMGAGKQYRSVMRKLTGEQITI